MEASRSVLYDRASFSTLFALAKHRYARLAFDFGLNALEVYYKQLLACIMHLLSLYTSQLNKNLVSQKWVISTRGFTGFFF